jgi:CRP-like cAMP-binding protein
VEKKARDLEKQVRKEPGNLPIRLQLAGCYADLGRVGDALEQYRAVATAYRRDGKHQQAAAVATQALALAPGDADLARLIAECSPPRPPAARVLDAVSVRELEPMRPTPRPGSASEPGTGTGPTPLPRPLAYHEADPSRIRAMILDDTGTGAPTNVALDVEIDVEITSPEPEASATAGLATAARRISQSLITAPGPAPLEGEDLAAELETRRRPRIDPNDLDRLGVPPSGTMPALEPIVDEEPTNPPPPEPGFETPLARRDLGRLDDDAWTEEATDPHAEWAGRPPSGVFDRPLGVTVQSLAPDGSPLTAQGGLSGLSAEVRTRVLGAGTARVIKAGQPIVTEGEPGESVFVIQAGEVRVVKQFGGSARAPLEVARLGAGAIVGEIAVMTDRRRHATVIAVGDVKVIEIPRAAIAAAAEEHVALAELLAQLMRARLASNLISIAPFFSPLGIDERARVLARFQPRKYAAGAPVIVQGKPAHGLFLVLLGAVDLGVRKADGSGITRIATFGEGAHVGELALMQDGPEPASVHASERGPVELAVLPAREFYQVVADHPSLWTALRAEAERRRAQIAAAQA